MWPLVCRYRLPDSPDQPMRWCTQSPVSTRHTHHHQHSRQQGCRCTALWRACRYPTHCITDTPASPYPLLRTPAQVNVGGMPLQGLPGPVQATTSGAAPELTSQLVAHCMLQLARPAQLAPPLANGEVGSPVQVSTAGSGLRTHSPSQLHATRQSPNINVLPPSYAPNNHQLATTSLDTAHKCASFGTPVQPESACTPLGAPHVAVGVPP